MTKAIVSVAASVMLVVSAGAAWAQGRLIPPALTRLEAGSCARCTLRLESVVTIGTADDKELVPENGMPATPRVGQFFVGDFMGKQPILQYDSLGRFIGTIGRLGDGPGEYRGAQAIAAARGDSIAIYKYPHIAIISIENGTGRSVRHAAGIQGFRMLALPDGSMLIQNYTDRNPAFVVVSPDGATVKAFGPTAKPIEPDGGRGGGDPVGQQFVLTRSPSGGFWAAAMNYRHLIEHWTFDGQLLKRIDRTPRWYTPSDNTALSEQVRLGAGLARPLPMMLGIWADGRGYLFVVGRMADGHWQKSPAAKDQPVGGRSRPPDENLTGGINRYYDGVIEVYDEATGGLLGSWRSDVLPGAFTETGLLVDSRQSEEGVKSFVFWRLRFDRD